MNFLIYVKMFIFLMFNINKNFFFERYKFLNFTYKLKKILFSTVYFLKNYIFLLISIFILQIFIKSSTLNFYIILSLILSLLIGIDNKQWMLFYRNDFVCEIPNFKRRFLIILIGNLILKFLIENNIILFCFLFLIFTKISFIDVISIALFSVLLYASILSTFFVIQNSSFRCKKLFSFINYLFSVIFTTGFVYCFIDFVIKGFGLFKENLNNGSIFNVFKTEIMKLAERYLMFFKINAKLFLLLMLIYFVISIFLVLFTFKKLNHDSYSEAEDDKNIVKNFLFLKVVKRTLNFFCENETQKKLINKEISLFVNIYKYNFKDYFFIVFPDRSFSFLIAIYLIVYKFKYSSSYLIMFLVTVLTIILDISSTIGVKLIVNMSFISDYNTLLVCNNLGFDKRKLIKAKLKFYYIVRSLSLLFMLIVYNIMYISLDMPIYFIIIANVLNLLILYIFPKLYLINNLIYTRIDYKDYFKYLNESRVLEFGVNDFFVLSVFFKSVILEITFSLIFTLLFNFSKTYILFFINFFCVAVSITVLYFIMDKIYENIINFIESGDFSVDFAKIFKK